MCLCGSKIVHEKVSGRDIDLGITLYIDIEVNIIPKLCDTLLKLILFGFEWNSIVLYTKTTDFTLHQRVL